MTTTWSVYVLHRGDEVPFYVGVTSLAPTKRERQHRRKKGTDVELVVQSAHRTERAGYRAEQKRWDVEKALGHSIENIRPAGVRIPFGFDKGQRAFAGRMRQKRATPR